MRHCHSVLPPRPLLGSTCATFRRLFAPALPFSCFFRNVSVPLSLWEDIERFINSFPIPKGSPLVARGAKAPLE